MIFLMKIILNNISRIKIHRKKVLSAKTSQKWILKNIAKVQDLFCNVFIPESNQKKLLKILESDQIKQKIRHHKQPDFLTCCKAELDEKN